MIEILENKIKEVLKNLELEDIDFVIEHPTDMSHGDYACNVAMVAAKREGSNPRELAEKITGELEEKIDEVEKIEIAGPGFINFYLKSEFFIENLKSIGEHYGTNDSWKGKKVLVEYIQPNPFKEFHIGHLMGATIGEFLARVHEANGAEVVRLNYQGDVGMHVAKANLG